MFLHLYSAVPSSPRNVTLVDTTDTTATLTWLPPLLPNGEVQLYRVTLLSESTVVQNTTGNETTLTVTGLEAGFSYSAQVEAFTVAFGPPSGMVQVLTREYKKNATVN